MKLATNNTQPQMDARLASNGLNHPWEEVIFDLSMLRPWREVAKLPVVSVIRHPHLWPNE